MAKVKERQKEQAKPSRPSPVVLNRQARHDYHILQSMEVGLALAGTEVKSIRAGRANLTEAFARAVNGEMWLHGAHIAQWPGAAHNNHEPMRPRKLLLHKQQIRELRQQVESKGLTLVPLKLYFKHHRAKIELALAKGKKAYDKRETIGKRDAERDMRQAMLRRR